ncbi:MAG: O-antigen ligase family protein [Parachlamydiales bacterium]|nr:O-antigen ligase family protein [Parachlamydiales bacterium]
MSKKTLVSLILLGMVAFLIPFEHKYDKLFRFYSLTLIPNGLEVSGPYDKLIYFYVSDLIAIILTCLGLFAFRVSLKKWFGHPLWIVWVCSLASIIASPFFHYPIPYFRLLQLLTPIALFSFITNFEEPQKITRIILTCIAAAGLIETVVGIAQYFHQAPLGLRFFGEVNQTSFFYTADGNRWWLDQFFNYTPKSVILMRAAGTLPHANVFGGFMLFSILATYYLSQRKKFWLYTLPFQFFALAVSYSRAALFAWGIATFLWLCFSKKRFSVAIVMTITLCLTAGLLYDQYSQRGGVVNYNNWVQYSDNVRKVQQETGVKIAKDHSIFGVGFTQFSERSGSYFGDNIQSYIRATAPHNIFLFLACETGLISLAAFLLFLALCGWRFLRAPKTEETVLFFSLLSAFLFIGLCDFYPILFQQGKLMFFLIASLLVANSRKIIFAPKPA